MIARKTKLAGVSRPAVLDGGPAALRAELVGAVNRAIADHLGGRHDWILFFATDRAALESQLPAAAEALDSPGTLWIAYPKGKSKRQSDLTPRQGLGGAEGSGPDVAVADLDRRRLVRVFPCAGTSPGGAPDLPLTAARGC